MRCCARKPATVQDKLGLGIGLAVDLTSLAITILIHHVSISINDLRFCAIEPDGSRTMTAIAATADRT